MQFSQLSPKEFLKSRRPERFSDTVFQDIPELDRSILEYHLDTLTNRSEELRFESFARGLLERTVCPNLLPHTGPSGGGDSKVDSETYPVAETLSMGWYVGNPSNAAAERWAFAFSAKKDWRPKVADDVSKIVATNRGYAKAFFVSSQFIRDKVRAEVEDSLRTKHGIDVRIFDRTWILNKVFSNRLEDFAIEQLDIKTSVRREIQKGPRDTAREQAFNTVEDEINNILSTNNRTPILVEKCLMAADLARSMERPRTEVEGLYARAIRFAQDCGTTHQEILCSYEQAWTTFWWHEDARIFFNDYTKLESLADGSRNVYELELWTNLFFCLHIAVGRGDLDASEIDLQRRAALLIASLDQVTLDHDRPSAVLQARALNLRIQLLVSEPDQKESILRQLIDVVREAEHFIGFPLAPVAELVAELGTLFGHLPAYQELFEVVMQTTSRRQGELSAARMLLSRGAQQIDAGQSYESIRSFGRAMGRLFKHESQEDAVRALYLCSHAYEQVGLLWAARGTLLAASALAIRQYWSYEEVTPEQAVCFNRMKWIELRLGRVAHLLVWHELDCTVRSILFDRGYAMRMLNKKDEMFDPLLGVLMLRSDHWDLQELTRLPDVLSSLQLPGAAVALLYALGHEDKVPSGLTGTDDRPDSRHDLFRKWRDQPMAVDLPPHPHLYLEQTVTLASRVAGCHVSVNCKNATPYVELAESLLACIEALLATAVVDQLVAREPDFKITIRASDFAEDPFTFETMDEDGKPYVEVSCRAFMPHKLTPEEQTRLKNRLFDLLVHILARGFIMKQPESLITKLFRDDLAPQRALDFTTSFVVIGCVLGDAPRTDLDSWTKEESATNYPLTRKRVWDYEDRKVDPTTSPSSPLKSAPPDTQPPAKLDSVSHSQIRTASLIREPLWNEASWQGIVFATAPDPSAPPILAILFKNSVPAEKIFKAWHAEIGENDEANVLRISIIRNINKSNPYWYRFVIGAEPSNYFEKPGITQVVMMSRTHTMTPESNENLDRFLVAFSASKKYILTLARIDGHQIQLANYNQIQKRHLVVRDAWQIGPHDPDCVGIQQGDDPVIPDGVKSPPVLETLKRIRRDVND